MRNMHLQLLSCASLGNNLIDRGLEAWVLSEVRANANAASL